MHRRYWIAIMLGIVLGVTLGALVYTTWIRDTVAQDDQQVSFDVSWGPLDDSYQERCERRRGATGDVEPAATLNGFREVITVRNDVGEIVSMTPLTQAELREPTVPSGVMLCLLTIDVALEESAGHTIWLDNLYLASIPHQGLPDAASIVLEDWD